MNVGGNVPIYGRDKVLLTSTEAAALWAQITGDMSAGRVRRMFDSGELDRLGVETMRSETQRLINKGSLLDYLVQMTRLQCERAETMHDLYQRERETLQ